MVYSFEQLPDGSTDAPYFISGASMAELTAGTQQPLSGLAKHVEDHMTRLKNTPGKNRISRALQSLTLYCVS